MRLSCDSSGTVTSGGRYYLAHGASCDTQIIQTPRKSSANELLNVCAIFSMSTSDKLALSPFDATSISQVIKR
jgi:hypothetical protein